jgi:threonylcarbamoyladenosine tRNA methylthiotransferase MtaB
MRRGYTRAQYADLLARVVSRGTVGIGADVIVGFPGEGDTEFEETYEFLEEAPVAFLHVFRYSARPGTTAARLDPPAGAVARERSERLRLLAAAKGAAFRRTLVGTTLPVIVEARQVAGRPVATSDVFVPVDLSRMPTARGIVAARILRLEGDRLIGEPVGATG